MRPRAVSQRLARAQSGAGTDQQPAGHPAADRGLGQRHVRRGQTHPDQREQQPEGDKPDHRGECVARGGGPDGQSEDQYGEADVKSQGSSSRGRPAQPGGAQQSVG